jgi:hypothetical protein
MRLSKCISLVALTLVGVLASIGSAHAGSPDSWVYKRSFGEELNTRFAQILVNHQTGNVLVRGDDEKIHQFDASGSPVDFAATGTPELPVTGSVAIANGGGATQGNIYTWDGSIVRSYHADGSLFASFNPAEKELLDPESIPLGGGEIFTAADGTLWVSQWVLVLSTFEFISEVAAVTPEGEPLGFHFPLKGWTLSSGSVENGLGVLYGNFTYGTALPTFATGDGFARLEDIPLSKGGEGRQIAIDPSNDDVYRSVEEITFDPTAPPNGWVYAAHPNATKDTPPIEVLNPEGGLRGAKGIGFDASGETMYLAEGKRIRVFESGSPIAPWNLTSPRAKEIRAFGAVLQTTLIDGGAGITYQFEYGPTDSYGQVSETFTAPHRYFEQIVSGPIVGGLTPDTTYHFRIVATNSVGTTVGPDGTFKTYPIPPGVDNCENALARKQTVAQRLPDCRAYELASASDTGGYDVESHLVPDQRPFPGFPYAKDKLLYATHSGAVPGSWNATNKGPDPYVATRTDDGWVTRYEGLPSDLNPAAGTFSSVLGEADLSLRTFAFAGPNLCSPCFASGLETGIPVRLPSGQLVQGMAGTLAGSVPPDAKPEGNVAKFFSSGGRHLVFASKYAFEPGANDDGSTLTVYDRDLTAGTTQIVSTDENGDVLAGTVSELDISADGSRIVAATGVSADSAGNEYVHPYMHIGSSPTSVDLAPGTTSGVLFAGMTGDGSRVFFTTPDALLEDDTDTSADLYEAAVDGAGALTLSVLTGPDSDLCDPDPNADGAHWNTVGAAANCNPVAIAGGGGVASASGTVYFLSPEQLDGAEGIPNQPNLYLAQAGGSPAFVATLEPDNPAVRDSVRAASVRRSADFQVTASGGHAAFTSELDLTDVDTGGSAGAYLFDADAGSLTCVSCDLTGSEEAGVFGDAALPPAGLALLEDGRLFFTTPAQLLLNDANARRDVYEWTRDGKQELISSGTSPFDSALLGVSADGVDVFFFTHDTLASEEDRNGSLMRIYDAREGGGFFKLPPNLPCQASDECHGPSSPIPPPPDIKSSGATTKGNVLTCPKNRVKKRGKCVKKPKQRKRKKTKRNKKSGKKTHSKRGGSNA